MNIYLYWIFTVIIIFYQSGMIYHQYAFFLLIDTKPDIVWHYGALFGVFTIIAKEFWPMARKTRTRMNIIITIILSIAYFLRLYFDVIPAFHGE